MGSAIEGSDIGVLGLAVMGANLARNFASRGLVVSVFNRTGSVTDAFMESYAKEGSLLGFSELRDFVSSLKRPRKILIMVKAGAAVDAVLEELGEFVDEGDIIIDAGNSFYKDSERREALLKEQNLHFFGVGVSGGEEGALKGPSIMPGGPREIYQRELAELFESIAAIGDGPCVTHIGPGGAGHFVKMVHNGIEYADMQLLAEAFDLMHRALGMSYAEIASTFERWNQGPLASYLVEISAIVSAEKDPESGDMLLSRILDKAGQKGTGGWTVREALELGVPVPSIDAAVRARLQSARIELRGQLAAEFKSQGRPTQRDTTLELSQIEDALYLGKILAYGEGIDLMETASREFHWNLDVSEIARIWTAGCIIRSKLLEVISDSYRGAEKPVHFVASAPCKRVVEERMQSLRAVVAESTLLGVPCPAFSAAATNFDSLTTKRLPQYFTQAQRDFFGAHTFERTDKTGNFHHEWGRSS